MNVNRPIEVVAGQIDPTISIKIGNRKLASSKRERAWRLERTVSLVLQKRNRGGVSRGGENIKVTVRVKVRPACAHHGTRDIDLHLGERACIVSEDPCVALGRRNSAAATGMPRHSLLDA